MLLENALHRVGAKWKKEELLKEMAYLKMRFEDKDALLKVIETLTEWKPLQN